MSASSTTCQPAQTAQVTATTPDAQAAVDPNQESADFSFFDPGPFGDQSHIFKAHAELMAQYRPAQVVSSQQSASQEASDSQVVYPNQQGSGLSSTTAHGQPCIDLTTGSYKPAQVVSPAKANAQAVYYNQQHSGFSPSNATGPAAPVDLTGPSPRQLKIPQPNVQAALSKAKALENGTYRAPVNGRAVPRPETSRKSPALKASNPLAAQKSTKVTKAKAPRAPKVSKATQAKAAKLAEALPGQPGQAAFPAEAALPAQAAFPPLPDLNSFPTHPDLSFPPVLYPTHLNDLAVGHTPSNINTEGGSCDPYLAQPISPPNLVEALKTPAPPSAKDLLDRNKVIGYQVRMARHLSAIGLQGPYEIGDFLCDVQRETGQIIKLAQRCVCPIEKAFIWRSIITGESLRTNQEVLYGRPISLSDGSFQSLNNGNGAMSPQFQLVSPDREAILSPPEEPVYPWKDYPDFETQLAIALKQAIDE